MKRCLCLLCALLLCCSSAMADNPWGRSGDWLKFLQSDRAYADYPEVSDNCKVGQKDIAARMSNGSEAFLMLAEREQNGKMKLLGHYPAAAAQPVDGKPVEVWMTRQENGFTIAPVWENNYNEYGHPMWCEKAAFAWMNETNREPRTLLLRQVSDAGSSMTFTLSDDGTSYWVDDGVNFPYAWETGKITIENYCSGRLPRTAAEVWQRNTVMEALGNPCMTGGTEVSIANGKTVPVYAAPDENAWRGANGKAAVALSAGVRVLATEGEWWLVEYEITPSKRRVGYVRAPQNAPDSVPELADRTVALNCATDTVLTDDPHGTAGTMKILNAGTTLHCFGRLDAYWAYVETEADGKPCRGFVALADLLPPENLRVSDVEAELMGVWAFIGGGEILGNGMAMEQDGSFRFCDTEDKVNVPPTSMRLTGEEARYAVYPSGNADYLTGRYVLAVYGADGVSYHSIAVEGETLSVFEGEGGGGYIRYNGNVQTK